MEFKKYESTNAAFKQVLTPAEFAEQVKKDTGSATVRMSSVIDNGQGNFIIVTLADGRSTTMPVSKKAAAGDSITDYMFALTDDNQWLVSTSAGNGDVTF